MNAVTQREQEAMKFILNGRTFDTATSTVIAISRGVGQPSSFGWPVHTDGETRFEEVLYRTMRGALFTHLHSTTKLAKGGKPITEDSAAERTPEEAVQWIVNEGAVIIDDVGSGLPLPPEA